ncbi:MAG: Rrf2 family transcriptional regulator [Alphaproteobacteria bacterium]|nr:Rrf2 family transcriptional regulator [Alphaproteobacteria bacterium]
MIRLTRKQMFAVEAVLDIAYNASDVPVQSKEIAERQGVPRRYLEQLLQHLVRADILRGVRGPRGGYRLARERRRITLGEIVRVVAETEREDEPDETGSELGRRVLLPVWRRLEEQALERLDGISVEDLCQQARATGIEGLSRPQPDFMI